jgi:integrase
VVFFFKHCAEALKAYLATHDHPYVFVSQRVGPPPYHRPLPPKPLTDSGIRQILRKMANNHGFQALKPHMLRHTCGAELAANGAPLTAIGGQFGHEDMASVSIYTRLGDERRREVLRRASPVDRIIRSQGFAAQ